MIEINEEYRKFVDELNKRELRERLLLDFGKESLDEIEELMKELKDKVIE